jgi:PAS domain-containing protein
MVKNCFMGLVVFISSRYSAGKSSVWFRFGCVEEARASLEEYVLMGGEATSSPAGCLLRPGSEFLHQVINALSYPFVVINAETYRIELSNHAYNGLNGTGRLCYDYFHQLDRPCDGSSNKCPIREVLQSGKPAIVHHVHPVPSGGFRYTEVHAHPFYDETGKLAYIIEHCIDVTDRTKVEQDLRTIEQRYTQLSQLSRIMLWEVDLDGVYTYVNPVVEKMIGYRPDELTGKKHFFDICPLEDRAFLQEHWRQTLESKGARTISNFRLPDLAGI